MQPEARRKFDCVHSRASLAASPLNMVSPLCASPYLSAKPLERLPGAPGGPDRRKEGERVEKDALKSVARELSEIIQPFQFLFQTFCSTFSAFCPTLLLSITHVAVPPSLILLPRPTGCRQFIFGTRHRIHPSNDIGHLHGLVHGRRLIIRVILIFHSSIPAATMIVDQHKLMVSKLKARVFKEFALCSPSPTFFSFSPSSPS